MAADGGYGWKSSFVHGEVPDGNYINVSKTYSDDTTACRLKITIKGRDGKPVDGARINLYSTNYQYSSTNPYILSAGYVWTNAQGQVDLAVGTGNKYYMKVYHPKFGSFPSTSGQVYVIYSTSNTVAGRTYSKTYTFDTTLTPQRNRVTYDQTEYPATKSLSLSVKADNVTTGQRTVDAQGGRFFQRTKTLGNVSIYVVDESNISRFKNGDMSANAEYYFGKLSEGQFDVPLHSTGKTYVVLTNNNNFTNYVELNYGYELKEGAQFDFLGVQTAEAAEFTVYPNPAQDKVTVSVSGNVRDNAQVEIIDMSGRTVARQNISDGTAEINISDLQKGVYIVKYDGSVRKIVKK